MKYLRSIVAASGLVIGSAVILPVTFACGLLDRSGRLGWLSTRMWAWVVLFTGGVRGLRCRGGEHLRARRGAVVIGNHESLFDPVVLMAVSGAPLAFVARHELFRIPLLGWAMSSNGHVRVRRGSGREAAAAIRRAARAIACKRSVVLYPEGSRSTGGDLLPFRNGGFVLAVRTGAPIVPVAVAGTRRVCPKGWHWAGSGIVSAVIGEPIDVSGYGREDVPELVAVVRRRLLELRAEAARLSARGSPEPELAPAGT